MKKSTRRISIILLIALVCSLMAGCSAKEIIDTAGTVIDTVDAINEVFNGGSSAAPSDPGSTTQSTATEGLSESKPVIDENGSYDTKDEVALYIHVYGKLPCNYISKKEAEKAGWSSGALDKVLPGMCIGGSRFGNYEGILPDKDGRVWTECDINTLGKSKRGAERIVFSNDGLIYYTGDHYEHFELLYGDPDA